MPLLAEYLREHADGWTMNFSQWVGRRFPADRAR
jgi:hypothetical protein